jgi:hypothetical protein
MPRVRPQERRSGEGEGNLKWNQKSGNRARATGDRQRLKTKLQMIRKSLTYL